MITQIVNIVCPLDIAQYTTVNIVIRFCVELEMEIVIQELAHQDFVVGEIIFWIGILFFLTVQAETPKMQKFVLSKVLSNTKYYRLYYL